MGRVHKKKIAEYTKAAENANNSKVQTESDRKLSLGEKSRSGDTEAEEIHKAGENGENTPNKNGGTKKAMKRKSDGSVADIDASSENELEHPRKSRKTTAKSTDKQSKATNMARGKDKQKANQVQEEELDENVEYEVQEVVDHKVEDGISYFLIRWKGYTKDDDTWEPESTLACAELIAKFKKKKVDNDVKSPKKKAFSGTTVKSAIKGRKIKENEKAAAVGKSGETQEYEVEKIINYAEEKSGRLFLIRWKGYAAKHDTWEPEDNLNCDEMIKKFMERMRTQENASFKELRLEPKKTKRLVNETAPRTNYHNAIGRTSKRSSKKR